MTRLWARSALALVAAPLLGWATLHALPSILPDPPASFGALGSVVLILAAVASAIALGYLSPRFWLVSGLAMAAPPLVLGVIWMLRAKSNLFPIGLAGLLGLSGLLCCGTYIGAAWNA